MKNLILRNPLVAGILAAVCMAIAMPVCTHLFFDGAGGGGRPGTIAFFSCIFGAAIAGSVALCNKRRSSADGSSSSQWADQRGRTRRWRGTASPPRVEVDVDVDVDVRDPNLNSERRHRAVRHLW